LKAHYRQAEALLVMEAAEEGEDACLRGLEVAIALNESKSGAMYRSLIELKNRTCSDAVHSESVLSPKYPDYEDSVISLASISRFSFPENIRQWPFVPHPSRPPKSRGKHDEDDEDDEQSESDQQMSERLTKLASLFNKYSTFPNEHWPMQAYCLDVCLNITDDGGAIQPLIVATPFQRGLSSNGMKALVKCLKSPPNPLLKKHSVGRGRWPTRIRPPQKRWGFCM